MSDKLIIALLAERKGLEARGLKDRIKAVDEQLRLLGYSIKETASVEPQVETATTPKPRRRKVD